MQAIRSRLVAVAVSAALAALGSMGVGEISPELGAELEGWLSHTFELLLFIGYSVIHPWLQARLNPTGAYTRAAARGLERAVATPAEV